MKFLIEIDENNEFCHDFTWQAYDLIKRYNYFNNNSIDIIKSKIDDLKYNEDFCPIGSIEFVHKYMELNNIEKPQPLNIPLILCQDYFLGRKIKFKATLKDLNSFPIFLKPATELKLFTGGVVSSKNNLNLILPEIKDDTQLFISEVLNFTSEWRFFIYKNKIIDCRNYLGDSTLFPDIDKVSEILNIYKNSPISYTLDIGITENNENFIIELHHFYSCGLYGMKNTVLLNMFYDWWINLKKNNKYEY